MYFDQLLDFQILLLLFLHTLLLCVQEFSEHRFFAFISLCADWSHNDHQNLIYLYTALVIFFSLHNVLSNGLWYDGNCPYLSICIFSSPEPKAHGWANSIPVTPASVRRPSSVNIFKHLLLWNHWANWTQILYGDSLGRGNESLFKWSWSLDQDGRHAHIL